VSDLINNIKTKMHQMNSNNFESMKLHLLQLKAKTRLYAKQKYKNIDIRSSIPISDMTEDNYGFVIVDTSQLFTALESSHIMEVNGLDSVYKISKLNEPLWLVTTTVKDTMNGVVLAFIMANSSKGLVLEFQVLYTSFSDICPKKFKDYFDREYYHMRQHWTRMLRLDNISIFNTNSIYMN
jgi:hypothetical protein